MKLETKRGKKWKAREMYEKTFSRHLTLIDCICPHTVVAVRFKWTKALACPENWRIQSNLEGPFHIPNQLLVSFPFVPCSSSLSHILATCSVIWHYICDLFSIQNSMAAEFSIFWIGCNIISLVPTKILLCPNSLLFLYVCVILIFHSKKGPIIWVLILCVNVYTETGESYGFV